MRGIDDRKWIPLLMSAQNGDSTAYHNFLVEAAGSIESFIAERFAFLGDLQQLSEHCLNAVHELRHTYSPPLSATSWMFAIVRFRLAEKVTHMVQKGSFFVRQAPELERIEKDLCTYDASLNGVVKRSLERALKLLSTKQSRLILAMQIVGLPRPQIAAQFKVPVEKLEPLCLRAFAKLGHALAHDVLYEVRSGY